MIAMKETIYFNTIVNIRDYLNDIQKENIKIDLQEKIDNLKSYAMQQTSNIDEVREKYTIYQEILTLI
jgi:hypothetical protein|tara:strand:- start:1079 stop:1282 length:204 start_codon:yes stop_codon:yes gene_type:complete